MLELAKEDTNFSVNNSPLFSSFSVLFKKSILSRLIPLLLNFCKLSITLAKFSPSLAQLSIYLNDTLSPVTLDKLSNKRLSKIVPNPLDKSFDLSTSQNNSSIDSGFKIVESK